MLQVKPQALLVDITRCVGCRACIGACMEAHELPGDPDKVDRLSEHALTNLVEHGDDRFVRELCRHCVSPSCASVCPVEALKKTPAGPVVYEASRCMGCRYCMQACPYNIPKYEWHSANPRVVKCDLCAPRLAAGKPTACAEACPAGAIQLGTPEAMLAEARRRLAAEPAAYYQKIYGENELGGTSVLFLSPVPFEQLGFPANLSHEALPELTGAALEKIPGIVTIGGALLFGIWWITQRREEVARAEGREATGLPAAPSAGSENPILRRSNTEEAGHDRAR